MHRRSMAAALVAGVVFLGVGCAALEEAPPAHAEIDVPVAAAFRHGAGAPGGPAGQSWVWAFDDEQLRMLVGEAIDASFDLRAAAAAVQGALARAEQVGAARYPFIDGSAAAALTGAGRRRLRDPSFGVGFVAAWEIDFWGRVASATAAADLDAQSIAWELEAARYSIAAAVARAWFQAIRAKLQITIDAANVEQQSEVARIVRARREAGEGQPADDEIVTADVHQANAGLLRSRAAYGDAVRTLEILLGRYPGAELEIARTLPPPPPPAPLGLPSELLERRPDVLAADRAVAAAFYRTTSARAARLPRIALTAGAGTATSYLQRILNPRDAAWNLGANLLAPIFHGGELDAEVDVQESGRRQALARYAQTAILAFREVESALENEAALRDQERELARAVEHLDRAFAVVLERYREGATTILDVDQVLKQLIAARSDLLFVRTARLVARVDLYQGLGGSFDTLHSIAVLDDPTSRPG
jgi:outer membrane protein, multidrug efflux system